MSLFITDNYDDHVRFVSQVENGSKLDEGQLGDELPPPPTYEAIRECIPTVEGTLPCLTSRLMPRLLRTTSASDQALVSRSCPGFSFAMPN